MSLESCIRKAGKALTKEDADAIRALRDDIFGAGDVTQEQANKDAVDEYLEILQQEREEVMRRVEQIGGYLANPRLDPSEFVKQSAENLEEAARKFPRKGIVRIAPETKPVDYKTGTYLREDFYARNASLPQFEREIVENRTHRSIEGLWPDFYTMPPDQILAIVAQFDAGAALGLAKHFDLIPQPTRSLDPKKWQWNRKNLKELQYQAIATKEGAPGSAKARRKYIDVAKGKTGPESDWFYGWAGEVVLNWVQKNEILPLYFKVTDPMARDFVEANPDSPLSALYKNNVMLDQVDKAPPIGIRKMINWLRDSVGITAALNAVPQTKLKDFVRHGMRSVKTYTSIVKEMDAWMNKVMEEHHTLAKVWLGFNQKHKKEAKILGEFMHVSTLSGVDVPTFEVPDKATYTKMNKQQRALWDKKKQDYEILKPFWDKLGKVGERKEYQQTIYDMESSTYKPLGQPMEVSEAQFIYLSVRDAYSNQRSMLLHNLEKRIEETDADRKSKTTLITRLRQQFEAGKISPYFALSRFGKYAAVAKTKEGEVIGFIKRENSRDRNDWMRAMRKQGFIVIPFEDQATDLQQMQKIDPNFVASVTQLLEGTAIEITDPKTGEPTTMPGTNLQDEIWQMYLRSLPELSARKAYIHRIGRLGFTHDALRSFSDRMFYGTHQMAKLKFGNRLVDTLLSVQEEAKMLMQRSANIQNVQQGWRPKGGENLTEHEALLHIEGGGERYRVHYNMQLEKLNNHEKAMQAAVEILLKEVRHDESWAVPMAEELTRRHEYNMNPRSAPWSTKLTALGFVWFLSTSPAAGVLNLSQTAISAYPVLRSEFGHGTGAALLKASKDFVSQPWLGLDKQGLERMTSNLKNIKVKDSNGKEIEVGEKAAMEYFWEIGIFTKTRTRELQGLLEAGSAYSHRTEKWLETAGYIFHKSEEMNRAVTALAAYRLAREKFLAKGMTEEDAHWQAIEMADELVEVSHYDYTNTNRPRFMQGDLGRVVFLFRNFSLNMSYRLIRDFRDGIWKNRNIPIEDRRKARSRFLGMLGMSFIFTGITGMPLFSALEVIANNLLGDDDEPIDSKTETRKLVYDATTEYLGEMWGEKIATAIMKGPWSAFTGADLSQRASLNNLWWRDIPQNLHDDPRGLLLHLAGEAAGPIFGIGMNFAGGFQSMEKDGGFLRTTEKFLPKFVGDYLKAIRYAYEGAQTYDRDIILPPEAFHNERFFLQAIGFTPTHLADRYEQNRAVKDMEQKLKRRRQDLINKLFLAWKLQDRQSAKEAMQNIMKWNKSNPRYPIEPRTIQQSATNRAQNDMRTVDGVLLEKRLQYLQKEMQFVRR
jgi:hypothetical protein